MSDPRIIAIERWGRTTAVVLLPRKVDQRTKTFRTAADALAFAEQLRKQHGWPIVDRRS